MFILYRSLEIGACQICPLQLALARRVRRCFASTSKMKWRERQRQRREILYTTKIIISGRKYPRGLGLILPLGSLNPAIIPANYPVRRIPVVPTYSACAAPAGRAQFDVSAPPSGPSRRWSRELWSSDLPRYWQLWAISRTSDGSALKAIRTPQSVGTARLPAAPSVGTSPHGPHQPTVPRRDPRRIFSN